MAKKNQVEGNDSNSLSDDVLGIVNKVFKDYSNAAVYLKDANIVTSWCSTGCDILDLAISNRPNGGLGYGTVVELFGHEGSGKSLLAAHIMAECQKDGGIAVLYDTEKAVGMLDFYKAVGLDINKTIYIQELRALEQIYDSMEKIIEKSIAKAPNQKVVIVVDSVMGASTLAELEANYDKEGYATHKALINSKAMRKIFSLMTGGKNILVILINQIRDNVNAVMFQEKHITSGGKAIPFAASTRIKLARIGSITAMVDGAKVVLGDQVEAKIVKNRLSRPGRKVTLNILYDSGIDRYGNWLTLLKNLDCVKQSGAYYSYEYMDASTGELITKRFQSKDFKKLILEDPELKQTIYNQICDSYIMKYNLPSEIGIDDIEIVDHEDEE
jgi:recombination protein RecA